MSNDEKIECAKACKEWRNKKLIENPNFYTEQYYKDHEKNLVKASNYYYKYHDENINKMRNWRVNNPEKMFRSIAKWRQNNPEKLSAGHKIWMRENAEHVLNYNRKRRAMKRKATIQKFDVESLNQRMSVFGYKCAYCRGPFEHIDHVKPLSKGGPHCLSNLRPSCAYCNLSKHNKTLKEWLQYRVTK